MENVKDWIKEWCELFPADIKWNNSPIKSKPEHCVNKMTKFCKNFPAYTKDIIFAATRNYLLIQQQKGWEYTRRSTYFIDKQGEVSLLEQYCEEEIKTANVGVKSNETIKTTLSNFHNDFI